MISCYFVSGVIYYFSLFNSRNYKIIFQLFYKMWNEMPVNTKYKYLVLILPFSTQLLKYVISWFTLNDFNVYTVHVCTLYSVVKDNWSNI